MEVVVDLDELLGDKLAKRGEPDRVESQSHGSSGAIHHRAQGDLVVGASVIGRDAVGFHELGHLGADWRVGRVGDNLAPAQVLKLEVLAPCELIASMHHGYELLCEHGNEGEVCLIGHIGGERKLVSIVLQVFDQGKRQALEDVDLSASAICLAITLDKRREIVALDGVDGPDIDASRRRARMLLCQGDALLKGVERLCRVFVEFGSVARQLDGSALAFEQGDAKLFFQLRDRIR